MLAGTTIAQPRDDFASAFEAAFARLQVRIEEARAPEADWPAQIAAGMRAGFEFAAADPAAAGLLTNEALAQGRDGIVRHQRLLAYLAELLREGRAQRPENERLPQITERAIAGGLSLLVAQRLDRGRAQDLPELAEEAIEFALTPYLGPAEAKRVAQA